MRSPRCTRWISRATDEAARQLARLLAVAFAERPSLVPIAALDYLRMGRAFFGELRHMLAHRIEDLLPRIGVAAHGKDHLPEASPKTVATRALSGERAAQA